NMELVETSPGNWFVLVRNLETHVIAQTTFFGTESEANALLNRIQSLLQSHELEVAYEACDTPALALTPYFINQYSTLGLDLTITRVVRQPDLGVVGLGYDSEGYGILLITAPNGKERGLIKIKPSSATTFQFFDAVLDEYNQLFAFGKDENGLVTLWKSHPDLKFRSFVKSYQEVGFETPIKQQQVGLLTNGNLVMNFSDYVAVLNPNTGDIIHEERLFSPDHGSGYSGMTTVGDEILVHGVILGPNQGPAFIIRLQSDLSIIATYDVKMQENGVEASLTRISKIIAETQRWSIAGQAIFPNSNGQWEPFLLTVDTTNPTQLAILAGQRFHDHPDHSLHMTAGEGKVYASLNGKTYRFDQDTLTLDWVKSNGGHFVPEGVSEEGVWGYQHQTNGWLTHVNFELESCQSQSQTPTTLTPVSALIGNNFNFQIYSFGPPAATVSIPEAAETILQVDTIKVCGDYFDIPVLGGGEEEPDHDPGEYMLLHEVCWESVEDYLYNQRIPAQEAISEDFNQGNASVSRTISPVWRPNTEYLLHFQLKDTIDDGQHPAGLYNYYYGFQTAGPTGHLSEDGQQQFTDLEALNTLTPYIDYQRSYPNADGNLLDAKPLYYGGENGNNTLWLYFTHPHVYHLVQAWPEYGGLPGISGELQIVIKDPSEDVTIQNPPPANAITEEIPTATTQWTSDQDPRMPEDLRIMKEFVSANAELNCMITGGAPVTPKSYAQSVTVTNLKPSKMYTALVNNLFNGVSRQVHSYVFQTSRFASLAQQVGSYVLSRDEQGQPTATAQFRLPLPSDADLPTALNIAQVAALAVGVSATTAHQALQAQYVNPLDRALEGALNLAPLAAAVSTEVNVLETDTGDPVGLLVRSPEPFNDPKLDQELLRESLVVLSPEGQVDAGYVSLYAKDYAQVLLLPLSGTLPLGTHTLRFQYRPWDGTGYATEEATLDITLA
ncbi:MAG: hypothetical protein AAFQ98_16330, partial [Bacteroidota bacterium]